MSEQNTGLPPGYKSQDSQMAIKAIPRLERSGIGEVNASSEERRSRSTFLSLHAIDHHTTSSVRDVAFEGNGYLSTAHAVTIFAADYLNCSSESNTRLEIYPYLTFR